MASGPSVAPDPQQQTNDAGVSFVTRFGSAAGMGLVATALAATPAAMRVMVGPPSPCTGLGVWTALVAAAVGPMIVAVVTLRGARVGLRSFGGKHAMPWLAGVAMWFALMFFLLTGIGAVLRATTHHHGLAGVTFALLSVVTAVALALASARVVAIVRRWPPSARWAVLAVGAAVGGIFLAVLRGRLAGGEVPAPGTTSSTVVDWLAFGIASAFASRHEFTGRRVIALFGPPAVATALALGISALRACPPLGEAIVEHAPAFAPALELIHPH
jgi:choline-sulfatase